MKNFRIHIAFLLMLATGYADVSAQGWIPSLNGETRFNRQLDALRWDLGGATMVRGEGYSFSLDNSFNSRLFMRDGTATNIQDENVLNLNGRVNLTENLYSVGYGRSYRYTSVDVRQDFMMGGFGFELPGLAYAELMGGLFSDHRNNELDQGPSLAAQISSQPLQLGDWTIRPEGWVHYADIDRRTYQNYHADAEVAYQTEMVSFQSNLRTARSVRESYQPSSFFNRDVTDIIEGVTSDTTRANTRLEIPLLGPVEGRFTMDTQQVTRRFESRSITEESQDLFNTESTRERMDLRASAALPVLSHNFELGLEYQIANRRARILNTEDFTEEQITRRTEVLDNSTYSQSRLGLFTQNRLGIAEGHRLNLNGRISILRYDTPELNIDDRDELSIRTSIGTDHHFSDYLSGGVTISGEAVHQVYLQAERSIENHWRRVLRLRPYFEWSPFENLLIRQNFGIRANYTVDDFDLPGRSGNNRSSREINFRTQIDWDFATDWNITGEASRSELRIGRLFWDSFTEIPTDTLTTYNFDLMLTREIGRAEISAGGRYFIKMDYLPQTTLSTTIPGEDGGQQPVSQTAPGRQITRQFGPAVDIDIPFSSGNRLQFRGWLQNQGINRRLFTVYPEEVEQAFRREEQRTSRRQYPNMELQVSFQF